MKLRNWSITLLVGMFMMMSAASSMAADGSQILRNAGNRGVFLVMTVLDDQGSPVSGVRVSALGSDLAERSAVTNSQGFVELDGLPNNATGTIAPYKNQKQTVAWTLNLESGKENRCTARSYTVYERNPLLISLPVTAGNGFTWETVGHTGYKIPVRSSKMVSGDVAPGIRTWQQLTFAPMSKGSLTFAHVRPWEFNGATLPMTNEWYMSIYKVIKRPVKAAAAAPVAVEAPAATAPVAVEAPAAAPATAQ